MRTTPFRPLVYFLTVLLSGGIQCYAEPLRVYPTNPRYFVDGSGRAVYLTGSHTWFSLVDGGPTYPPATFDYNGYLDFMHDYNHNFIRLWSRHEFWEPDNPLSTYSTPSPWMRTGPGTASDGRPRFDLTRLNQPYFDRLRLRVASARDRGIYVGVMIFKGDQPAYRSPFGAGNNINGIDGDVNGTGEIHDIYELRDAEITQIQEAYVRKVIDTVGDLDNVLYEIGNEILSGSGNWQQHMVNYIHSYDQGRHPVGVTCFYDNNNGALWNSAAEWISPGDDTGDYNANPTAADGTKVVLVDSDHISAANNFINGLTGADHVWVWRNFARGNHVLLMDSPIGHPPIASSAVEARIDLARRAMGDTLRYANKMNLAAMTPRGNLTSTSYALANPGQEYLVFAPNGGSFTVNLTAGNYDYEWFNPATGNLSTSGSISASGGNRSFPPPFSGAAVLYLVAASQQVPASVTFSPSQPAPGQAVSVTATGGPINAADWVGVFKTGTSNDQYLDWKYLNNTQSVPASGVRPGIVTINAPTGAGTYEFRFFNGAGDVLLATSSVWTITAVASRCDFNVNGSADSSDMQLLVNALLANSTSSAYDLNRDSKVNVLDVQTLVNVILGTGTCPL